MKSRGLHFVHLNTNSIKAEVKELKLIALHTNVTIIGISESKHDETLLDKDIQIKGYNILRSDRNRYGGGVACYIRDYICLNLREQWFSFAFMDTANVCRGAAN